MLALAVSDIHDSAENLQKIVELIHNRNVELALILGDLTNFGGQEDAERILQLLEGFEVMAIAGNLDTHEVNRFLEESGISLHARKKKLGKFTFAGFGGGLIGNPGRFLFTEEDVKASLLQLLQGEENVVLLTHLPPFGTKLDLAKGGAFIGSKSVKEAIDAVQPVLHLCGHVHEASGEQSFGKTLSINVGAVKDGKAALINLETLEWERIQI